jgi:hypothetical protein
LDAQLSQERKWFAIASCLPSELAHHAAQGMSLSALSFTDHNQNSTNAVHVAWQQKAMNASANAVERITERQHEMEYDPKPDNLIHKAVEEAVNANPRLALMPYEQMKAAARILAKKVIAAEEWMAQNS